MGTNAVQVVNACKGYGDGSLVLNNLNMTVKRGTIYGLLGASGCGKTTMLSCIVGIRKLDSGDIHVFGTRPGTPESGIPGKTIGYMPQDIALYTPFTIKEILQYFGRIYGMTSTEIKARTEFLINFLDLPESNRRIGSLSGGQQRRTSLAVALVHQPALLILDEPTVGVDPLIRESIWKHLCEMANRGTTVIITTHYIEEARHSSMVGLMRNGRLLVQQPPLKLLEEYNTTLLEDIVLVLCKKDTYGSEGNLKDDISKSIAETSFYGGMVSRVTSNTFKDDTVIETTGTVKGIKYKTRSPDDATLFWPYKTDRRKSLVVNMKHDVGNHLEKTASIFLRNLILVWRNPILLVTLILVPTFQVIAFSIIIGKSPQNIGFAVVNKEFESTNFLESCKKREDGCLKDKLSCSYINTFSENNFNLIPMSTEEEGLASVQRGQTWGYVLIPSNFTEHTKDRSLARNFVTNETMDGTQLTVRIDNSLILQSSFIRSTMYGNYLKFLQNTVSDCGEDPRIASLPMKYKAIYGSIDADIGYRQHIAPSQIILIIFLLPTACAITFILDKRIGTLERSMVAGIKSYHILGGLVMSEVVFMILELGLCLSVAVFVFNVQIQGSVLLVVALCILTGIVGLSFGFLFGVYCGNEIEAVVLIVGTYLPTLLCCGGLWPLPSSGWISTFSNLTPCTLPIEAFRSIASRGWGFTHPHVWPGFAILICWMAFNCLLSTIILKFRR